MYQLPVKEICRVCSRIELVSNYQRIGYPDWNCNTPEAASIREISESYDRFTPMQGKSLHPEKYNRYYFKGNIAELISDKGIAKGGSFIHTIQKSYYKNRIAYDAPDYWLGFLGICEILPYRE